MKMIFNRFCKLSLTANSYLLHSLTTTRSLNSIYINIKKSLVITVASIMATLSIPSMALDGKTFPGNACQPQYNTYPYKRATGRVFNSSFSTQNWYCPITRDVMAGRSEGIDTGFIWVVDMNSVYKKNVICTLHSQRANGTAYKWETKSTGIESDTLTYSSINPFKLEYGVVDTATYGNFYYKCSVPAKQLGESGIVSYNVNENN